jgi:thymidylate synthase (FAD)
MSPERDQVDPAASFMEDASTRRATVPAMEEVLSRQLPVLDHGFIRVIDYMGDDGAIVQAARVSYGRGTKSARDDQGLINYLMRMRHTSPFEMCELKLHVKLPIFIARQWIRHRTANVNEYSARYSVLGDDFYVPEAEHLASQSGSNRQGRAEVVGPDEAAAVRDAIATNAAGSYERYLQLLNRDRNDETIDPERQGIARELARMTLPLNTYTEWYWKIDLHNLLHFIALRIDPHAQYEIRAYAEVLLDLVRRWVPMTAAAFQNHRLDGAELSGAGLEAVRRLLKGESEEEVKASSALSAREWRELMARLGRG